MNNIIISLKDINKTYCKGKPNECHALKDFSLDIEKGDFVAIIGKSGAGKSTLLHILAQIESYSGTYLYENQDLKTIKSKRRSEIKNKELGLVLQSYSLVDSYTVFDNVMLPLLFGKHIKPNIRKEMVMKALEKVDIQDLKDSNANKISGGQRQRVAIARALINDPKVILLDEPTGALDDETSNDFMNVLKLLNSQGVTIVMVTHNMEFAKKAKKIIKIKDGVLIETQILQEN